MSLTGKEIIDFLRAVAPKRTLTADEARAWDVQVESMIREEPAYVTDKSLWLPLTVDETGPDGVHRVLRARMMADCYALGTAADPFRIKGTPFLYQRVADRHGAVIATRKLLAAAQALTAKNFPGCVYQDPKSAPYNIKLAEIDSFEALVAANNMANAMFDAAGFYVGQLLSIGHRKGVIVSPDLDGSKVDIQGGRASWADPVQPESTIHPWFYFDYSHGLWMLLDACELSEDGGATWAKTTLKEIGRDKARCHLVSASGWPENGRPFELAFPSVGSAGPAKYEHDAVGGDASPPLSEDAAGGGAAIIADAPPTVETPLMTRSTLTWWQKGLGLLAIGGVAYSVAK